MNSINSAAKRLLATIQGFSAGQKTIAVLGVAILVLGGVALTSWLGRPTYSPLFTGLAASDASGVVAQLQKDKVEYQLTDGGGTILVPVDKVDPERLAAASAGLPSSSTTGYSLLDNMNVTASEFQQNVTYKRAIEGELAKTIESIGGVASASVQLAVPQKTVFTDQQQDPTASVFVNASTPLTTSQVQAIVHLTSAAYPGLKDTNVSVVDQKGETLSALGGAPSGSSSEQATDYETSTRAQIQAMLDRLLGPGNSTVTVAADISASSGQTTSKTYTTPTQAPVLSESSNTSAYKGSGSGAAAGVLGSDTTTLPTTSGAGTYTSKQGVKNNAVNETTTTQTITPGSLTRQTIAVAVNSAAAASVPTGTIQSLVAAAAGVNATRGDTVTVAAASFSNAAALTAKAALAQGQAAQAADNMSRIVAAAIWVVGAGLLLLFIMLVLRRRRKKQAEQTLDGGQLNVLPVSPSGVPVITAAVQAQGLTGSAGSELPTAPATKAFPRPRWAEDSSPFAQLQADVDALAGADPERTVDYLRALMSDRSNA